MATYGIDDIEILSLEEAIRKRPGMYIGDAGKLGAARLIQLAVDVLAALAVNRGDHLSFTHHAFLNVSLTGREAHVAIDFNPSESPDITERCASLLAHRDTLRPDPFALDQSRNSAAPMPILAALSTDLSIVRANDIGLELVLAASPRSDSERYRSTKGAFVDAQFRIREEIDTVGLTEDYLQGFLEGSCNLPGLVVRDVSVTSKG